MNTTASTRIGRAGTIFLLASGIMVCSLVTTFLSPARAAGEEHRPGAAPGGQDKNQQAADLLRRARQAMADNNLSTADSLIAQAEALGVEYSAFNLTGDTPKKARKDLERQRSAAAPTRPSQLFSPLSDINKKNVPSADPFAGRVNNVPSANPASNPPNANGVTLLPKLDNANPVRPEAGYAIAAQQGPSDQANPRTSTLGGNESDLPPLFARTPNSPAAPGTAVASSGTAGSANDNLLRSAREKLALGDLRRANDLVQQAKAQNNQYGPMDDDPRKVEDAIRKMYELSMLDKNTDAYRRGYARNMMEQGDAMLRYGQFDEAERLANLAAGQQVAYGPFEPKPQELMNKVTAARRSGGAGATPETSPQGGVALASHYEVASAGGPMDSNRMANRAVYDPANDPTRTMQVQANSPRPAPPRPLDQPRGNSIAPVVPSEPPSAPESDSDNRYGAPPATDTNSAQAIFQQGEAALKSHNNVRAYQLFRLAAPRANELDPASAQRLQGYMQMANAPGQNPAGGPPTAIDETVARQQVLLRQIGSDLAHQEANARGMLSTNPQGALELLEEAKKKLENAGLDPQTREIMIRRVDRSIADTKQFIEANRPQIELAAKNERVRQDVANRQKTRLENQEKISVFVDDFNRQVDEQRYEEALVTAKKAAELYPKEPVVQQMLLTAKFIQRFKNNEVLRSLKEEQFVKELDNVEKSAIPFDSSNPYLMPEAKEWKKLTDNRRSMLARDANRNRTEREIEIEKRLKTPVLVSFKDKPLSQVVEMLSKYADINIYLDPKGMNEEGITTDTPITIDVKHEIMLKSALKLILDPLHLSYVIKDEVLKITSERMKDGEIFTQTYNVADLVIPIPNFVPIPMGFDAAYNNAMAAVGYGGGAAGFSPANAPLAVVADNNGKGGRSLMNPKIMAQLSNASAAAAAAGGGRFAGGAPGPIGFGPGGLGGGTQADFDSLIELITATIKPTSWDKVGGSGSIQPFETNLSIVVSQTQEVHEEIVDLLGQLRRMQDLQVTIEVRFITLNDNFFERIGVDFDFDIHDYNWGKTAVGFGSADNGAAQQPGVQTEPARNTVLSVRDKNATVGMGTNVGTADPSSSFTSNLDIPFRQNTFGLAIPQFGGFDPSAGATMGFAILSDIEAYFFVNAAQGDKRSNVLQAPKVTLFNGQQAFVADQSQTPFVTSVIPVVGDFAAAQQPVIVVLSEGTFMTVQAVVSQDRRFVRLTVVPFFSKIGDVKTFTFTGTDSSTVDTSRTGNQVNPTDATKSNNVTSTSHSGTTVQLPTFSYVSVTTTVSVPDGGTVLLGGIKRLSEGRSEFGVPLLADLPYINRLFKNVAVGRETQSLMMMVTPRIIIQEEEEGKLGIQTGP